MTEKLNPGQFEARCTELAETHERSGDNYTIEFKKGKETVIFHWDGGDGYTEEVVKGKK